MRMPKIRWLAASAGVVAIVSLAVAGSPASAAPSSTSTNSTSFSAAQLAKAKAIYEQAMSDSTVTRSAIGKTLTATQKSALTKSLTGTDEGAVADAAMCWTYNFGASFGFIHNNGSATWCGNNVGTSLVTYDNSTCSGWTSYPTNKFDGCTQYKNYGVGWTLYQVKFSFHNCYAYIPIWGSCVGEDTKNTQFQFAGNGLVYWNGGDSHLR
jgi:hypothetical protein